MILDRRSEAAEALARGRMVALAVVVAIEAHEGQVDKAGEPYIGHPQAVAQRFDAIARPVEYAAAWLHDVIEDTPMSLNGLAERGIPAEVLEIVDLLTRKPDVSPAAYYAAIRRHPKARAVKLADIRHNLDPERLAKLEPEVQARLRGKYARALEALGAPAEGISQGTEAMAAREEAGEAPPADGPFPRLRVFSAGSRSGTGGPARGTTGPARTAGPTTGRTGCASGAGPGPAGVA